MPIGGLRNPDPVGSPATAQSLSRHLEPQGSFENSLVGEKGGESEQARLAQADGCGPVQAFVEPTSRPLLPRGRSDMAIHEQIPAEPDHRKASPSATARASETSSRFPMRQRPKMHRWRTIRLVLRRRGRHLPHTTPQRVIDELFQAHLLRLPHALQEDRHIIIQCESRPPASYLFSFDVLMSTPSSGSRSIAAIGSAVRTSSCLSFLDLKRNASVTSGELDRRLPPLQKIDPIRRHVSVTLAGPVRPADSDFVDGGGISQAEVSPEVVL